MSATCKECSPMPVCLEDLDRYSLQDEVFGFVLNCPPGFYCGSSNRITIIACDGTLLRTTFASNSTAEERQHIIQGMLEEYARRLPFCDPPPTDVDNPVLYYNRSRSCSTSCGDGSVFTYTVPPAVYAGPSQAQVDELAQEEACLEASNYLICLGSFSDSCCRGVFYSGFITISSAHPPFRAFRVSGTLPPGIRLMTVGNGVRLFGVPTTGGLYTFRIRVLDSFGNSAAKTYSMCVVAISPDTLPDAPNGAAYSQTLTAPDCFGALVNWTITAGALPDGLELHELSGIIDGTPLDTAGDYTFTVRAQNQAGLSCMKQYTLTVTVTVFAYFKLDDAGGAVSLVNSVDAFPLALSSGSTSSVSGKIGTAVVLGNGSTDRWINGPNAHWVLGTDFTIRFWINLAYAPVGNNTMVWAGSQWTVWHMPDFWAPGTVALEFIVDTDPGSAFVDTAALPLGTWLHVVFWYEQGVGVGVKINNGSATLGPGTDPIDAFATLDLNLRGWHDMGANIIDEIAIWKRVLSTADITYDYNGGAGRTYPDLP